MIIIQDDNWIKTNLNGFSCSDLILTHDNLIETVFKFHNNPIFGRCGKMGGKSIFNLDNRRFRLIKKSYRKHLIFIFTLILLGGIFGLAYAATYGVATVTPIDSAPGIGDVIDLTTENSAVGPYDNAPSFPENVIGGTGGRIGAGNLFYIRPHAALRTGVWIQVEMVNRKDLNEYYTSFTENIAVYKFIGTDADNVEQLQNNDNWQRIAGENVMLTLVGGPATFIISYDNVSHDHPLVIALDSGDYYAKEGYTSYPGVVNYCNIEEAANL